MPRIRSVLAWGAVLGVVALPAAAEQGAREGEPLAVYCNSVPDLSVKRTDAVDNWVKICSVWLAAACKEAIPESLRGQDSPETAQPAGE